MTPVVSLKKPLVSHQVVVKNHGLSRPENHLEIDPRDRIPPPFVVDSPAFHALTDFLHRSPVPEADWLSIPISHPLEGGGESERAQSYGIPGIPVLPPLHRVMSFHALHGSSAISACRRSGIRDQGSTSTTR
jgi:hypothetical protein